MISVLWGNAEQTTIQLNFIGRWSWPEFTRALEETQVLFMQSSHHVTLVLNLTDGPYKPLDHILFTFQRRMKAMPRNLEQLIIVGGDSDTKTLLYAHFKPRMWFGWRPSFVNSLVEARAAITKSST